MPVQLLLYKDATPVTVDRHRDLSVKTGANYNFAKGVNSVPLTAIEFAQAAAEYPIVFAGTDDAIMPAVILGVQQTENLFVDESGTWQSKYIPAFVRRYPFVFSNDKTGKTLILHVDESFDGCNREGRGERLFDSDGLQTQYLKSVLNFLQDYQARFLRTKEYCDRLRSHELLQSMQANFNPATGEPRSLSGFMTIDREKLKKLSTDDLEAMFRNDELECTYLHLHSLRHFGDMLERLPAPSAEAETANVDDKTGNKAAASDAKTPTPKGSAKDAASDAKTPAPKGSAKDAASDAKTPAAKGATTNGGAREE